MLNLRPVCTALVASGVALAVLAGCGSDEETSKKKDAKAISSASTSAPAPYLDVPEGVTLTEPGIALDLGDKATVAFQRRQDEVDIVEITVERIERTSFRESFATWNLSDDVAARTPYFVRVSLTNADEDDLGGRTLNGVLWANDGSTLEAPNGYTSRALPACAGKSLPKTFPPGASVDLCEVYFIAPAQPLKNMLFQPPGGLEPITWSGKVSKASDPSKKQKKAPKKKSSKKSAEKKSAEKKSANPKAPE
ncbi:MAG: hypothetical protein L0H31_05135 [Nocardioidaceae bacterium]|nr:hypothetical protein [Nocardioidaceae bacterium]